MDGVSQRPHKRTGVWSSETVKNKNSTESGLKRLLRSDKNISGVNTVEEDEVESPTSQNRNNYGANITCIKSDFSKLPVNMNLLLNQFNNVEDIKENDSVWSHDLLFAEIMNKISNNESS